VGVLKDYESVFEGALLHLSAFPLQAFLYETQKRELYGDELRAELRSLISYAKKNKKTFWFRTQMDWNVRRLQRKIASLPVLCEVWKEFDKNRSSKS
jgi:hypothetical protein